MSRPSGWRGLALILLLAAGPSEAACPAPVGASLRIKTWNLNLQVAPNNTEANFGMPHKDRAAKIAQQILAEDADVVVLNEANDDDARDVLVKQLAGRYPHYIHNLDEHDTHNDSGLMLFSKYGFAALDHTINDEGFQETWHDGKSDDNIASWDIYSIEDSNGSDAWANKGFALVRIVNECDGRLPFNVGFTHMQSSVANGEAWRFYEDYDDRKGQLRKMREVIEGSIEAGKRNSQLTFVLGDLNIDGSRHHEAANRPPYIPLCDDELIGFFMSCPGDPDLDQVGWLPFTEWEETFGGATAFWSCKNAPCTYDPVRGRGGTFFVDSWAYETSPLDVGQTHSIHDQGGATAFKDEFDGERLDYILHNKPAPAETNRFRDYCVQHLTRATRGKEWSDHISVTVDVNRVAPRCSPHPRKVDDLHNPSPGITSPNGPEPVVFRRETPDVSFADGRITFPGSMQWYVIDQRDAFRIELTGLHVDWEIYQGADLSTPLAPFDGECEKIGHTYRCNYTAPDPPYFVRVFAVGTSADDPGAKPDRTRGNLSYSINFHRFDCSSIDEACPLEPAVPVSRAWPDRKLGRDDTMYFKFLTEHDRNGNPPAVELAVGMGARETVWPPDDDPELFDPLPFDISVARKDGTEIPGAFSGFAWDGPRFGASFARTGTVEPGKLPGANGVPEKYFLKVARHPVYQAVETTTVAAYQTSLTYFQPLQIACLVEETDLGGDDIWTRFIFDGPASWSPCRAAPDGPAEPDCLWVSRNADGDGSVDETDEMYAGTTLYEAGTAAPNVSLPFELTGAYQTRVVPNLWQDGEGVGGEQHLQPTGAFDIPALDMSEPDRDQPEGELFEWKEPGGDEYWYQMVYRRSHARPPCHAGPRSGCPAGLTCKERKCQ